MTHKKRLATLGLLAAAPEFGVAGSCTTSRSYCTAAAGRHTPEMIAGVVLASEQAGQEAEQMHWDSKDLSWGCRHRHLDTGCQRSWDRCNSCSWVGRQACWRHSLLHRKV